jgi:hypothetical protein
VRSHLSGCGAVDRPTQPAGSTGPLPQQVAWRSWAPDGWSGARRQPGAADAPLDGDQQSRPQKSPAEGRAWWRTTKRESVLVSTPWRLSITPHISKCKSSPQAGGMGQAGKATVLHGCWILLGRRRSDAAGSPAVAAPAPAGQAHRPDLTPPVRPGLVRWPCHGRELPAKAGQALPAEPLRAGSG